MSFRKIPLILFAAVALAGCSSNNKPYTAAIIDKLDPITDVVIDDVLASAPTGQVVPTEKYSIVCIHFTKTDDNVSDKTLKLADIQAYMGNEVLTPKKFAQAIGNSEISGTKYYFASTPSDTFEIKRNEASAFPYAYVCFENKKIDKNVTIKVKDQQINHSIESPTQIDL